MKHKIDLSLAQVVPPQDGARSGRYYNKRPAAAAVPLCCCWWRRRADGHARNKWSGMAAASWAAPVEAWKVTKRKKKCCFKQSYSIAADHIVVCFKPMTYLLFGQNWVINKTKKNWEKSKQKRR